MRFWRTNLAIFTMAILFAATASAQTRKPAPTPATKPKTAPLQPSSELRDAEAAMDRKDFAAAEQKLKSFTTANPKDYRGWFDLGYVYIALGRRNDAIEAMRRSVAAQPDVPESNVNLGALLAEQGDAEGGRYLRAALRLKLTPELRATVAKAWIILGDNLSDRDRANAIDAYAQAIAMNPDQPYAHLRLGSIYEREHDSAKAEQQWKTALNLDPTSEPAVRMLTNLYLSQKRTSEAEPLLRALLQHQPSNAAAHVSLARVLHAEGKDSDAEAELERALQLDATNSDAMRELAQLQLENKEYDHAVATVRVLLSKSPNDPELRFVLGESLLKAKQYADAERELMATVKLRPEWPEPYGNLAIAASENRNYQLAIQALDAKAKLQPETAATYYLRAQCYDHMGASKEASEYYKRFLSMSDGKFPDEEWKARHRLIAIDPETRKKAK